ncbi:ribosomal protein S18 acetylase RimI-like enzyme [Listeria rocourtiae]|uniref:Ribosomal protein S18 acetylase RimI-like enzyme n=2 Tax=Listeria rocourtiae TaxID=647910 RepID=A0A4R6ZJ21_9LIST|nr:GNAT family N-acetyltransferase [Listeria rocourtiae]TDR51959.1 ribosomal protein S18 acetylase RimI-like enzyme [Listeria rocourtiae]
MMITKYRTENLDSCVSLLIESYNCEPWNDCWTPVTARKYLEEFAEARRFIGFLFWDGNEIIGVAFSHERTWMDSSELYIDEFYISPHHQRMGIGKKLMRALEDYAVENGCESIALVTDKDKPAFEFYKEFGLSSSRHTVFMFKSELN